MDDRSRGELLAQQALGRDSQDLKAAFNRVRVVLGLPDELARTRHGQIGLLAAANILGRLGALAPALALDVPASATVLPDVPLLPPGQPLGKALLAFAQRLASVAPPESRCLAAPAEAFDIGLFVGKPTTEARTCLTIGADRWRASLRADGGPEAVETGDPNPLGIILAASLGAAEVVKHMWFPYRSTTVPIEPLRNRTTVSAYDFSVDDPSSPNPPMPGSLELGHICVFGLGATGSACLFTLACFRGFRASVDLVDPDRIEPTNLERLFTCGNPPVETGQPKAFHARNFLATAARGASAFAYPIRFESFVDQARDRLGYVWCCLDNSVARRDLQLELPSVVCNGGTDGPSWTFSTHEYGRPERACLRDLYPPPSLQDLDPAKDLAGRMGLELAWVKQWQESGEALGGLRLEQAVNRQGNPAKKRAILAFRGLRYQQAVARMCSTMRPHESAPAATIGFVAIQPGVAMVADLVKRRAYGWQPGPDDANLIQFNTLRCPSSRRALTVRASTQCLCQSPRYRQAVQTRKELRAPHLGKVLTAPAFTPQPPPPHPLFRGPRRRFARPHLAALGQPPAAAPGRGLPGPGPPPAAPQPMPALPALRGGRRVACIAAAWQMILLAGALHMATLGAVMALAGLVASWAWPGDGRQPWSLLVAAWKSTITTAHCLGYLGVAAALGGGGAAGMLVSAPVFRAAFGLMRLALPGRGYGPRGLAARGLTVFYCVTAVPVVEFGVLALGITGARLAYASAEAAACCACAIVSYVMLCLIVTAIVQPAQALAGLAARMSAWAVRR